MTDLYQEIKSYDTASHIQPTLRKVGIMKRGGREREREGEGGREGGRERERERERERG